jgi:hypothetical protein
MISLLFIYCLLFIIIIQGKSTLRIGKMVSYE